MSHLGRRSGKKGVFSVLRRWQFKVYARGDCWEWRGGKMGNGYGSFDDGLSDVPAHAFGWESAGGLMPFGTTDFDHLCRHRWCVRPSHLQPVTRKENLHRGDHPSIRAWRAGTCMKGHTDRHLKKNGKHNCRECERQRVAAKMSDPAFRAKRNKQVLAAYHRRKANANSVA